MNKCTFTQTTKFTSLIPPHDENFEQIQCENITEEKFDEYGRAYCKEHRIKVDEINKSRHKNGVNKEKIIKKLDEYLKLTDDNWGAKAIILTIIQSIKNGEFD